MFKAIENGLFSTPPLFDAGWTQLEFRDETYPTKTTETGLPYGDNFIILNSTIFV